ncbi:DUF2278 family protein [Sphingobium yanoikuyae]|uniref:DUF2278 family protein n=1 Tax=Sphingobium yanoikuyae TaxID=13690 RepID=UPI000262B73F|nr:DUF2278 family protein [Sphingobium yanoikuyae]
MPLKNYAILKGRPVANRLGTSGSPHYQVQISADGEMYRIAINVRSQDGSEVQFLVRQPFEHPLTAAITAMEEGCVPVPSALGGVALDFIRGNLAQPWEFVPLPINAAGPDNDLNEKIDGYVQRAMADERAMVYAFGETWGPEEKADKYFGFKPGRGIHDIHMNQGNPPGPFAASNGPWQDGGLVFEFPEDGKPTLWTAIFLKFQTQAWHSVDDSGTPLPNSGNPPVPLPVDRDIIPPLDQPDGLVRIIAALVNDVATPETERVTLLNTADRAIDLTGWALKDKMKAAKPLSGTIAAGATLVVDILPADAMKLSNRGGIISLIDANGVKVHGVAYTREQAAQPGRTIPFQH